MAWKQSGCTSRTYKRRIFTLLMFATILANPPDTACIFSLLHSEAIPSDRAKCVFFLRALEMVDMAYATTRIRTGRLSSCRSCDSTCTVREERIVNVGDVNVSTSLDLASYIFSQTFAFICWIM